ncbi:MAG: hypothetical protein ABR567_09800 [Myxococcales bacterium]|nr:hypothetical protein [Myxococcales bacterium]
MFTSEERERLRTEIIAELRADPRVTGAAITGSASVGKEDRWSDIDLAFGVRGAGEIPALLNDCTERMFAAHGAAHHVDVQAGAWIYRVFLLRSSLQVDLAFAPASEFGARAPSFKLVHGVAAPAAHLPPPRAEFLAGMAWLHALHVRPSVARGRHWQAEYMLSAARDHALALACLRHGLPTADGRGFDSLPADVRDRFRAGLTGSLEGADLVRAFRIVIDGLIVEIEHADPLLAQRLRVPLRELLESTAATVGATR